MVHSPNDAELIERFNGGDDDAFRVLYERYRDWVYQLAWRLTGAREEALDVVAEVFTYLAAKRGALYLSGRMTTLLYPVTRHEAIRANKRRRRIGKLGLVEIQRSREEDGGPRDLAALAEAMDSLTEDHREIILLRFVHEMDLADIAGSLELPVGTVKSRLHHAIRRLREHPAAGGYFQEPGD